MIDYEKGFHFLESLESPFLVHVSNWLSTKQDPTDLLLDLSHHVGQALGPWETFRFCSLFHLTPAAPVRELGMDVLAETYQPDGTPPIAQAFSVAHAYRTWPEHHTAGANDIVSELLKSSQDGLPQGLLASAIVALTGPQAAAPQPAIFEAHTEVIARALEREDHQMTVMNGLESILLSGTLATMPLRRTLWELMPQLQNDDGSFPSTSEQRLVKGLMTAKALALGRFWAE